MRIAIVGSRDLTEVQQDAVMYLASAVINNAASMFQEIPNDSLQFLSGGAPGVDEIAEQAWRDSWTTGAFKTFYPELSQWEPNGYKERNIKIATECDELVCIRSIQSNSYGSAWTADYAEKLGKRVYRYYV